MIAGYLAASVGALTPERMVVSTRSVPRGLCGKRWHIHGSTTFRHSGSRLRMDVDNKTSLCNKTTRLINRDICCLVLTCQACFSSWKFLSLKQRRIETKNGSASYTNRYFRVVTLCTSCIAITITTAATFRKSQETDALRTDARTGMLEAIQATNVVDVSPGKIEDADPPPAATKPDQMNAGVDISTEAQHQPRVRQKKSLQIPRTETSQQGVCDRIFANQ